MRLPNSKVRLIHVAKARLGLTDDDYRAVLRRVGGVESSRDLDDDGFELLMSAFAALGFKSTSARREFGLRPGMASPGQVGKLRQLWARYTAGEGTDRSLGKWLEGRFKVSSLRFVPPDTAHKAIGGLMQMCERRERKAVDDEHA